MFRSLMFKSNPLTEEFQRYRRKVAQTLEAKPFSIKSGSKNNKKLNVQKSNPHSQVRKLNPKTLRYQQFRTINHTPSTIAQKSPDNNKDKCKFKIHNTLTLKNDNFLQKDEIMLGKHQKQQNPIKGLSVKNSILNPENQKLKKIFNSRLYSRHHQRQTNEKSNSNQAKLTNSINIGDSVKNKSKYMDPQLQNKLKSTLYQSIDLGNLFEKIQSNIDQSQKVNSLRNNDPFSPFAGDSVTKRTKIRKIQMNRHQLKGSSLQNKIGSNGLNLKNLIEKNGTSKTGTIPTDNLQKSFFQNVTSRQQHSKKQTEIDPSICELNQKVMQHSWMPTRRKRSIAIKMDENGLFKEESSGALDNEVDSLRMSMKISNIRQMIKGEPLEYQ